MAENLKVNIYVNSCGVGGYQSGAVVASCGRLDAWANQYPGTSKTIKTS